MKGDRKRKATQFKPGWRSRLPTVVGNKPAELNLTAVAGASDDKADDTSGGGGGGGFQPIVRLTQREAADVVRISGDASTVKLRPRAEKDEDVEGNVNFTENIIVNIGKFHDIIVHMHATMCKKPRISTNLVKRIGLCVFMQIKCCHCGYETETFPLSETVKREKGPPGGVLNDMCVLPVLKSKVGIEDVTNILTCLNIKGPSRSTMQRKLNSLAISAVKLNEKQMADNQRYCSRVLKLAGAKSSADVQFDVAYTVRPQGGSEKAAQSFGALIEHSTAKKLPIAIATANKHCRKRRCKHTECSKNFPSDMSIASSERHLLFKSLESVENAGNLKIGSITTDSGTQSSKAIRDYYDRRPGPKPRHYKCLVHKLRALEHHLKQLKVTNIAVKMDKAAFMRKLASCIRIRVRKELMCTHKLNQNTDRFVTTANAALKNILPCFSGNHKGCREHSRVCRTYMQNQYDHLPGGSALKLCSSDQKNIQTCIEKSFSDHNLQEVCQLYTTNMCESMNSAVFNYAPKSTCYTRNFQALCHSATHTRTLGLGHSVTQLAAQAGIRVKRNSVFYTNLAAKDRVRRYHSLRKASAAYKTARYFHRKRKMNKSLFQKSLYSSENIPSCSATDHSYGLTS